MKTVLIILLVIFRLWLTTQSKHGDIYNNLDWGRGAAEFGLASFYDQPKEVWPHSRPNQPPGSILLHLFSYTLNRDVSTAINFLNTTFGLFPSQLVWWWESNGELLIIKLPSVIADFFIALGIYQFSRKLAFIFLLHPFSWYISSYWGQTDTVVAAFAVWSLIFLKRTPWLSALLLGLSLIIKATWAPLVLIWLVYVWLHHRSKLWHITLMAIPVLIVSWPFHPYIDIFSWLINLYTQRILPGESGFVTINAFNFWHLLMGAAARPETLPLLILAYSLVVIVIGLSLRKISSLFYSAHILFLGYFLFAPRMHERYSFPALILLTLLLAFRFHKTTLVSWLILSILFLINVYNLWFSPQIPGLIALYNGNFTRLISLVLLLLFVYETKFNTIHS